MLRERAPDKIVDSGRHFYTSKNHTYPSISTVLSATAPSEKTAGLERWRQDEPAHKYITQTAIDVGQQLHRIIEDHLNGSLIRAEFDLLPLAHFENLRPSLEMISDIACIEQPMYSDELKVAGTSDLIARYDGVLSVIDYKTKRRKQLDQYMYEYYLQTTCYAKMFQEATGQKIEQIVILVSSEKNTRQEFARSPDDYLEPLTRRIEQYYQKLL